MSDRVLKGSMARGQKIQFTDFDEAGRQILAQAQQQAEQLLAEAQAKADSLAQVTRQQALAEGKAAGMDQARQEVLESTQAQALAEAREDLAPVVEVIKGVANQLSETATRYETQVHEELVILAVEIARKVIGREIQLDPELVAETVRRAVELVLEKQRLTIRLHPKDAELVAKAFPEVESTLEGTGWVVKPDESVDRGGAVIHTEHGELDARIEAQLTEIARALSRRESEGSA